MRDYHQEAEKRVKFIQNVLRSAGAGGIVFGNSGGKDCALVGILCKKACDNTLGLIMPCGSKSNYESDKTDAEALARGFGIETRIIDLTGAKNELILSISTAEGINDEGADINTAFADISSAARANIAPRLRMAALYTVAANENRLVAGTGNRSEIYMGYFTKWGDGGYDFNPIADLTVTEVYEFLRYLGAPAAIIEKAPSAGLFEGQTD
jgi:NAD+ synthase